MLVDSFAKLNRSSRSAIFGALVIISAIAMYNWIVAPHVAYLSAAQRHESVLDNIAKKNEAIKNTVELKKEQLQQLRERSALLQSSLFTPNQAKEFISDLEAIAKETDCAVYSLNFSTGKAGLEKEWDKEPSGIVANSVMLAVIGVYENLIGLVEKLRAHTQGVWIDSIKMKALDDNSSELKCDVTITIYTIRKRDTSVNG